MSHQQPSSLPAKDIPPSIYFGGCAFGLAWYIGIYKGMLEHWGSDFTTKTVVAGASAGTIMAVGMTLAMSPEDLSEMYQNTAKEAKFGIFHNGFEALEKNCLTKFLEEPDAYQKLSSKCYIGLTGFFTNHFWVSQWSSNSEVLQCLRGSLHVPLVCEYIEPFQNKHVVDGAYGFDGSSLLQLHGDNTLYVGSDPLADIGWSVSTAEMLFPSEGDAFEAMVNDGYQAFKRWVMEQQSIDARRSEKVTRRQPNRVVLVVLWIMKAVSISVHLLLDNLTAFLGSARLLVVLLSGRHGLNSNAYSFESRGMEHEESTVIGFKRVLRKRH